MSEKVGLEVTASANLDPAVKGLRSFGTELSKTAGIAAALPGPLDKASTSMVKAGAALNNVKPGANQAANALQNLGRVAQDAPFGFIGIQNNLNPLLESFQRLKTESGSTGGALKALAGSLMGAGGVGLALSAVSAIITVSSVGFGAWTRGLSKSKEALDETAKAAKEAADAYQSIVSSVAKEVASVETLVQALQNEKLSRAQRKEAIEQLQAAAPAYFATLNSEKATIEQISAAYDAYGRAVLRNVELRAREAQLNKVIERRLELQDKGNKLTNITVDANGKVQKSYNAIFDEDGTMAQKSFNQQLILTKKETEELNNLLVTEKELLRQIGGLSSPARFNVPIKIKPDKVTVDEAEFVRLAGKGLLFGKETVKDLVLKPKVLVQPKIEFINDPVQDQKVLDGLRKIIDQAKLEQFQAETTAMINETLGNIGTEIAGTVSESIGKALSGDKAALPDLFGNLIRGIGSQISNLGKALVQAGIKMLVAKKAIEALKLTPQTAIIAGVALQILGSALQASLSKQVRGFATGVRNFAGGMAVVGERGRELVQLPRGSNVIPNGQTNAMQGNAIEVTGILRGSGTELYAVLEKTKLYNSRNGF